MIRHKAGVQHELVIIPNAPHTLDLQPTQRDLRPFIVGLFKKRPSIFITNIHHLADTQT